MVSFGIIFLLKLLSIALYFAAVKQMTAILFLAHCLSNMIFYQTGYEKYYKKKNKYNPKGAIFKNIYIREKKKKNNLFNTVKNI